MSARGLMKALAGVARVLVHRIRDLDLLKSLDLTANVTLFAQGGPAARAGASGKAARSRLGPLIGSYGFFLPGKGVDRLIAAAAQLIGAWPSLRLRLVNAAYPGIRIRGRDRALPRIGAP